MQAFIDLLPAAHAGVALRHAIQVRHESFAVPEFVAMARKAGVAIVFAQSDEYPAIADIAAAFVYARLETAVADQPDGHPPADLDPYAAPARCWAAGGAPQGDRLTVAQGRGWVRMCRSWCVLFQ